MSTFNLGIMVAELCELEQNTELIHCQVIVTDVSQTFQCSNTQCLNDKTLMVQCWMRYSVLSV